MHAAELRNHPELGVHRILRAVGRVRYMQAMLSGARVYNQPLDAWDVSEVRSMNYMFGFAPVFNQPLDAWDVGQVSIMTGMFANSGLGSPSRVISRVHLCGMRGGPSAWGEPSAPRPLFHAHRRWLCPTGVLCERDDGVASPHS